MMYHRQRSDTNQAEIVKELRAIGATVLVVSAREKWDLQVGFMGKNYMLEVKQPGSPLRPKQKEFHAQWRGQIDRVENLEDCLKIMED